VKGTHIIDECNRVSIPYAMRGPINWEIGDKLTALVDQKTKTITLFKNKEGDLEIDSFSRITLSEACIRELGWSRSDELALSLDEKNKTITLSLS